MWMESAIGSEHGSLLRRRGGRCATTLQGFFAFLLLTSCQGEYPLAPTVCDYWCAAEQRGRCSRDEPVECVGGCEKRRKERADCDVPRQALADCVNRLPESAFRCDEGYTSREPGTCGVEMARWQQCDFGRPGTLFDLCDRWAFRCAYAGPTAPPFVVDAGDLHAILTQSCRALLGSGEQICGGTLLDCLNAHELSCDRPPGEQICALERALRDCLNARELSCDRPPGETAACAEERVALQVYDAPFRRICDGRSRACGRAEGDASPPERVWEACWASRPPATGPTCAGERRQLYDCLSPYWTEAQWDTSPRECDVMTTEVSSCRAVKMAFDACVASQPGASSLQPDRGPRVF